MLPQTPQFFEKNWVKLLSNPMTDVMGFSLKYVVLEPTLKGKVASGASRMRANKKVNYIKNINFTLKTIPHPSLKWHLPQREGLKQCKVEFTRQNLRKVKFYIITYNFVPKNAMKLHFDKSFTRFFQKIVGYWGNAPRSLVRWILLFLKLDATVVVT